MAFSSLSLAEREASDAPAPCRVRAVVLRDEPASPAAVPTLRRFACDAARGWHVPDEAVERLAVVVTELVTNSVLHSHSPEVSVTVDFIGTTLTVEVRDSGVWQTRWFSRLIEEDDVTGGRGLDLVRQCCTWWLAFPSPVGTRVVACLSVGDPTEE